MKGLFVAIQLLFLIAVLSLGTWCVNYDLGVFHKHIPTFWAFVLTLVTGNASVVLAIVLKVLLICGVIGA